MQHPSPKASLHTAAPIGEASFSIKEVVERISKFLGQIRLPFKGISSLFAWAEIAPFKKGFSEWILLQRIQVKTFSSTFNLPKFFIKQIKLFHSCKNLKEQCLNDLKDPVKIALSAKKVFLKTISAVLASLKMPLLLDKLSLINLSKYSRTLAGRLDNSETLLTLALTGMKLVDSVWSLSKKLSLYGAPPGLVNLDGHSSSPSAMDRSLGVSGTHPASRSITAGPLEDPPNSPNLAVRRIEQSRPVNRPLTAKTKNQVYKVISNSVHLLAASCIVASLFVGLPISLVIILLLSSLSFIIAVVRVVVREKGEPLSSPGKVECRPLATRLPS